MTKFWDSILSRTFCYNYACTLYACILYNNDLPFCWYCQGGFQALARRASEERFLQRAEQDQTYIGVSGESYMYFLNQFVTHINFMACI